MTSPPSKLAFGVAEPVADGGGDRRDHFAPGPLLSAVQTLEKRDTKPSE